MEWIGVGWNGVVYLIRMKDSNYYKLGFTNKEDVKLRLDALQTGNPRKLIIVATLSNGSLADEQALHIQLANQRTDGGSEWFELEDKLVEHLIEYWDVHTEVDLTLQDTELRVSYEKTQTKRILPEILEVKRHGIRNNVSKSKI